MKKISVLIVDDSATVRKVIGEILDAATGIKVMGTAQDPIFAMKRMERHWPDVIVLDVEMPRMDGLTFLQKIMSERPTPVVICSTLTEKGSTTTMKAVGLGAVEIITKPKVNLKGGLQDSARLLVEAVRAAAKANLKALKKSAVKPGKIAPKLTADAVLTRGRLRPITETTDRVVAIGTSTGGTQALESVLTRLPKTTSGIVVVQHMPEKFTAAFAKRLDGLCQMQVKEAEHHDRVIPGRVLIAPGGRHMLLQRNGAQYRVEIKDGPLVSRHRPSVDVLFRSTAQAAGGNAVGIIMTGMGDDGAAGLKEMHDTGARTVAQDQATCVVYGMPKEAVERGAADVVMPLDEIPQAIVGDVVNGKTDQKSSANQGKMRARAH